MSLYTANGGALAAALSLAYGHQDFVRRNTGDTNDAQVQHYLQNNQGVLANNRHFIGMTRAEYQPNGDATTEGQALHIIGYCHMYLATRDVTFLNAAKKAWDAYITYYYAGQPVPTTPKRFICNWLVNGKEPILAHYPIDPIDATHGGFKAVPLVFTNGRAKIPQGAPFFGEWLDTATFAHRGHMTWEAINASVQKIKEDVAGQINWQTVYDSYRITTGVTEPWKSSAWINWQAYLGDVYTPVWSGGDTKAKEYPVDWIIAWTGNKIDVDAGDIIDGGYAASEFGTIQLKDTTVNGVWLFNYASRVPVAQGGYMFARNEPWHNRPVHTPFKQLKADPPSYNQLGNAADAELWFIDSCYLLWRITGEAKYKQACDCAFFTSHEYTYIDSQDKFFRQSVVANTPFTDGISYDFSYPNTAVIEYGRDAAGYITVDVDRSAQHYMEQQSVWFRVDHNAKIRATYGGIGGTGELVSMKVMLDVSPTKEEVPNPTWYGLALPKSGSMTPVSRDIPITSLALMTNPATDDDYMVADARAVTDYGGCTWAEAFETNVHDGRQATVINAHFPDDDAGFVIGFWLTNEEAVVPRKIVYKADQDFNMRMLDGDNWRWWWMLPATGGNWATVEFNPADATLSGYQPDHPDGGTEADPEPSTPNMVAVDQITILLDANTPNANFSYYVVNDVPPLYNIPNGWTMTYRMMLNCPESYKAVIGDCTMIDYRLDSLAYAPGVIPFSNIYSEGTEQIGAWHGMPYPGYQYPFMYTIHQDPTKYATWFNNQVQFMHDSQAAYSTMIGELGPGCAAYIWNRWDNYKYGPPDTWTNYHWGDGHPWAGYQPRAFNAAARAWYELKVRGQPVPEKLQQYVENWAYWLIVYWGKYKATPTDFPSTGPSVPVPNDFTGHMCGLFLAGAVFAKMAGSTVPDLDVLIEGCVKELADNFTVTSIPGKNINGAWSPAPRESNDNGMAFGFYTGEIFRGLGMYLLYKRYGADYDIYSETAIPDHALASLTQ